MFLNPSISTGFVFNASFKEDVLTQIKFDFGHPSADGIADLAGETVHVIPTSRFNSGKRIVVRDSFEVRLDEYGTATVTVPPTDNTFAYEVTIGDSADSWRFIRVVQVPDSTSVLNFSDLVEVDSTTLTPVGTGNPLADIDQSDINWALAAIRN